MARLSDLGQDLADATRLLIFSCGNASRGDDGIGPWIHHQLHALITEKKLNRRVHLIEDFQWQIEDVLEIEPEDLVLFVDAALDAQSPYALTAVKSSPQTSVSSHALSPSQLLAVADRLGRKRPLGIWQLAIPGQQFELGTTLSDRTCTDLKQTLEELKALILDWKA